VPGRGWPAGAATPQAAPASWKKTIYELPETPGKSMNGFSLRHEKYF